MPCADLRVCSSAGESKANDPEAAERRAWTGQKGGRGGLFDQSRDAFCKIRKKFFDLNRFWIICLGG